MIEVMAEALIFKRLLDEHEADVSWIGNDGFDSFYWTAGNISKRICVVHVYVGRYEVEVDKLGMEDCDYVSYKTPSGAFKRAEKEAMRQYDYYAGREV